jgi:hypothetical protein
MFLAQIAIMLDRTHVTVVVPAIGAMVLDLLCQMNVTALFLAVVERVRKDQQAQKAQKDQKDQQDQRDQLEIQAPQETPDQLGLLMHRVSYHTILI